MKELYKKIAQMREFSLKVVKSADNPFFRSKYSDLNSVIEVTDPILEEVGLIYVDRLDGMNLISEIIDPETGSSITSTTPLLLGKQDSQSFGSALTYARRFNRVTMFGLQAVDDDGSVASGTVFAKPKQIKEINELILKTKSDATKLLQYFHVDSVKNLTEQAAVQAIKTLTLKLEKEGKDG